jgi:hypothetical protein
VAPVADETIRALASSHRQLCAQELADVGAISVGPLFDEPELGGVQCSVIVIVAERSGKDFALASSCSTPRRTRLWPPPTGRL